MSTRRGRWSHAPLAVALLLAAVGVVAPVGPVALPAADAETPALSVVSAATDDITSARVVALGDGGAVVVGRTRVAGSLWPLSVERIDASGARVWRHDMTDLAADRQFSISVAADDTRIVVAGTVRRRSDDGFVRVLDHAGTTLTTTYFSSADHRFEAVESIALLPDGAVVVAGRTNGELVVPRIAPSGTDGFIALVEPDGSVAWTQQRARTWGETGPVPTVFDHALVAPDGRILVVSEVFCNRDAWCAGQQPELAVLVLDRAGTLADVAHVPYADLFPGAAVASLRVGAVVPGPDGIVVTAYQSSSSDSMRVSGLGWDLAPAWAGPSVLGESGGLFSHRAVASVTADGRIVVGAATDYGVSLGGPNQGGPDALVAVLSDRGELLGVTQHGGPADDDMTGAAVLADGRVLVVGYSGEGYATDGLTADGAFTGGRFVVALDPAAAGRHVHVPGAGTAATTVSTDAEWGDPDAEQPAPPEPPAPVSVDGAAGLLSLVASERVDARGGEVAVVPGTTGTVEAGWTLDAPRTLRITRRDADGTALWARTVADLGQSTNNGEPQVAVSSAADGAGAVDRIVVATSAIVGGSVNSGHVLAHDPDGTELWSATIPAPAGAHVLVDDVHVAPDGSVIVVGASSEGGDGYRPMAARYGPDGTLAWSTVLARPAAAILVSVHVAPDGTIVAVEDDRRACSVAEPCTPRAETHLVRIAPEDGSVIERVTHRLDDLFGMAVPMRVDGNPFALSSRAASGPDGPVYAGLVMNDAGEYCLVVAGVGWDLARRFAGPATHCGEGRDLELWGSMTVLADGRVVTGSASYYDVAVAGPSLGHVDVVLGVHDASGVLLDAVQYGGTYLDIPTGIVATADGDVIVATSSGAGVTSLGSAPSVTAVGELARLTLVGGVVTWRDTAALRTGGSGGGGGEDVAAAASSSSSSADATSAPETDATSDDPVVTAASPEVAETEEGVEAGSGEAGDAGEVDAAGVDAVTAPSAPQDVQVTVEYGRILVAWSAPADTGGGRILDYRIEVTDVATGALVASRTGLLLRATTVLTPLGAGDVRVRIAAINAAGTGEWASP